MVVLIPRMSLNFFRCLEVTILSFLRRGLQTATRQSRAAIVATWRHAPTNANPHKQLQPTVNSLHLHSVLPMPPKKAVRGKATKASPLKRAAACLLEDGADADADANAAGGGEADKPEPKKKQKKAKKAPLVPPPQTKLAPTSPPPADAATFKAISWNVDGIRAAGRRERVIKLLEDERPDILCIQETKVRHPRFTAALSLALSPSRARSLSV